MIAFEEETGNEGLLRYMCLAVSHKKSSSDC